METKTMDINEQIALDLEKAQHVRFWNSETDFWTPKEIAIFERIKSFRYMSMSYTKIN